jgi:hypothetical protein
VEALCEHAPVLGLDAGEGLGLAEVRRNDGREGNSRATSASDGVIAE